MTAPDDLYRVQGWDGPVECIETHISRVILTPEYAYKLKKPVKWSFVDFSTLALRRFYCTEEVRLNRRLAPDLYLGVVPVARDADGHQVIGLGDLPPSDFAVWMKRMDGRRQMDRLLADDAVTDADMIDLARILAAFHRKNMLPADQAPFDADAMRTDFNDLFRLTDAVRSALGEAALQALVAVQARTDRFLDRHATRLRQRAASGFWVDGHGDLHTRNIFLPVGNPPLVFDCLEFSEHLRRIDVLNELAFLCMDLEARGRAHLATAFMQAYTRHWNCLETAEDSAIFQYFKAYRANVRLKVSLLGWREHPDVRLPDEVETYLRLLVDFSD